MVRPNYREYRRGQFVLAFGQQLMHSAKGSTWEDHKYIKRIDGTYYYPDSYQGGRHLPDGENSDSSKDDALSKLEDMTGMKRESLSELRELALKKGYDSPEFKELLSILSEGDDDQAKKMIDVLKGQSTTSVASLSSNDVEKLAKEVIRGNFGNGQQRKDLLGENYDQIQKRVNELLRGSSGSKEVSSASKESVQKVEEVAKKVSESKSTSKSSTTASKVHSGVDMGKVMSVYNKKRNGNRW